MVSIWHPDKHQGNSRRQRRAEEKTKQINEAYEIVKAYIQDGRRPKERPLPRQDSHESNQGERIRTVYVEKEKPIYIKKSSKFSKGVAWLATSGMVISMTMCANRDEHYKQAFVDFQSTISRLEYENAQLQKENGKLLADIHNLKRQIERQAEPKAKNDSQATNTAGQKDIQGGLHRPNRPHFSREELDELLAYAKEELRQRGDLAPITVAHRMLRMIFLKHRRLPPGRIRVHRTTASGISSAPRASGQ